jgi:uroporphyrinogen-III decarboxylase
MRLEQWETFKRAANQQAGAALPLALIVDSPWIPGYLGIGHLDYFFDGDTWFEANLKIAREFADVILFPSWWVECGMAIETSALGNRIHFRTDQPPAQSPALFRLDDVEHLAAANPEADGLMPLALHRYRTYKQRIFDAGYTIPAVASRGPLCLAAFLRGVTEFMIDITEKPEAAHKLLALTTETAIRWLQAQAQAIGTSVECILVLDDIVGFLSRKLYLEFAHPYLKRICEAFPREWVKVYHNDANVRPFLSDLPATGFQVLNWSHRIDIREARERTGGKMCLMGNVAPLDVGVRGTPEEVEAAALEVLRKTNGEGMILSVGGGVSPGMPKANILALIQAAHSFCAASAVRTPGA